MQDEQPIPLDVLENMVLEKSQKVAQLAADKGLIEGASAAPPAAAPVAPPVEAPVAPAAPVDPMAMLGGIDPALITSATQVLVQLGALQQPSAELTPEVLAAVQSIVDAVSPGLYDLTDEAQLTEALSGIAAGTLGGAPGSGSPAPGPVPGPGVGDPALAGIPGGPPPGIPGI